MRHRVLLLVLVSVLTLTVQASAWAYVGPGAGLSLLGALWGVVAAVVAAVGFILFWPFRRLVFKRRSPAGGEGGRGRSDETRRAAPESRGR